MIRAHTGILGVSGQESWASYFVYPEGWVSSQCRKVIIVNQPQGLLNSLFNPREQVKTSVFLSFVLLFAVLVVLADFKN